MLPLRFDPKAEAEIDVAFEWYWAKSPDAAIGFLDELAQLQARIRTNAQQFPLVQSNLHKAVLSKYPFYLLFRIGQNGIEVLVVAHAKRRPGYWGGRI